MSRPAKFLSLTMLIVFLLACNFVTQPLNDAQNLAQTAQSVASSLPVETLQAAATAIASAIPEETLQALPSAIPSLEALATNVGNMFDPQGTPVQEWRGIPIMPQATAGQEFAESNTYSFRIAATTQEIQDFYNSQLEPLGWNEQFSFPTGSEFLAITYTKDQNVLTITMTSMEGYSVVTLTIA